MIPFEHMNRWINAPILSRDHQKRISQNTYYLLLGTTDSQSSHKCNGQQNFKRQAIHKVPVED